MKKILSTGLIALSLFTLSLHADKIEDMLKLEAGEIVVAKGKIAYSLPMKFDYDKNGTRNSVVMGAHLFIKKTKEGEYKGFLERGLFDIDKKISISWYMQRSMLQQAPLVRDISVKNVLQNGTTIMFDIENTRFTVIDGGKGHMRDSVIIDNHIKKPRVVKLYDGDIKVIPPK